MRDNKPLEQEALDLATYKVAKYYFEFSKPNCDKDGGDFLIHREYNGNGLYKIIKCQSKGRNISKNKSNIRIDKNYVIDDFVLFLYLKNDEFDRDSIYFFVKEDIEKWENNGKEYCFHISQNSLESEEFEQFYFNKERSSLINEILSRTAIEEFVRKEFITDYSDLNNLYFLWKETASIPDLNLTHKLFNDFDDYEHFFLDSFLFLLCISIYNEQKSSDYLGIDWAFQYLKNFNDVELKYEIENVNTIKRISSDSAITYNRTFIEIVSCYRDNEQINGFRLVVGDNEECFESYLLRDGNCSLKYTQLQKEP